jgi:peroxiredoxin
MMLLMKERSTVFNLTFVLMVGACLLAACARHSAEPALGSYRASLQLPGGEAPFGLDIAREGNDYILTLLNGEERTRVTDVEVADGELRANFPGYESRLQAHIRKDALEGEVTLIKAGGKEQVIPFAAKLGAQARFFDAPAAPSANVTGRWALVLKDAEGETTTAVGIFDQQGARVTGTVMTPTGDHRYLEGQISGEEVRLSTFSGGLAYLYHLKLVGQATMQGEYWQGLTWHENISGQRNDAARLDEASIKTTVEPDAALSFSFPDANGTLVSLDDERFRGKVVLVTIGGTWCPNCHDEARFLVPFYQEHRARGFEIVGLMFERHGEFDKAAAAVRHYQQDLSIDFPLLIAGVSDNDDASKKLPALSGVYGYPTAILVDKQGKVRDIHTGFSGPATGTFYEEYTAAFERKVVALLAE